MKYRDKKVIVIFLVFITVCTILAMQNYYYDKDKYRHLFYTKVNIPTQKLENISQQNVSTTDIRKHKYILLVYTDSNECNSCKINDIKKWEEYIKKIKKNIYPVFVFAPQENLQYFIKHKLSNLRIEKTYIFYIDHNNTLKKENPNVFIDETTHVLLLDKNYRIIIIGNPLKLERISNIYKSLT